MIEFERVFYEPRDPLAYRMEIFDKYGNKIQDFNIVDVQFMKHCGYTDLQIEEFRNRLKEESKRDTI